MNTTMTRALGPVLAGLSLVGLAACGGGYDRQDAKSQLVEAGATDQQADCMLNDLEVTIGKDRLGERGATSDDLTAEEQAAFTAAFTKCLTGS